MENDVLRSAFEAHTFGQTRFTRRMAITIADMLEHTPRQIILKLERMRLLKPGSWDWFADNGGITKAHVDEVRTANGSNNHG